MHVIDTALFGVWPGSSSFAAKTVLTLHFFSGISQTTAQRWKPKYACYPPVSGLIIKQRKINTSLLYQSKEDTVSIYGFEAEKASILCFTFFYYFWNKCVMTQIFNNCLQLLKNNRIPGLPTFGFRFRYTWAHFVIASYYCVNIAFAASPVIIVYYTVCN